jgi:hypothetical protein
MQILVWMVGIAFNGFLGFLCVIVLAFGIYKTSRNYRDDSHDPTSITLVGAVCGSLVSHISIILLYLDIATFQGDLLSSQTFWPLTMAVGYYITLVCVTAFVVIEFKIQKTIGATCIFILILVSALILGNLDYLVLWGGGHVVVVYAQTSEFSNVLMGFIVGFALLYQSFNRRISAFEEDCQEVVSCNIHAPATLYFALSFFAQFLVPRAITGLLGSVISVKIFVLLVSIMYLHSTTRLLRTTSGAHSKRECDTTDKVTNPVLSSEKLVGFLLILGLFFVVTKIQTTVLESWSSTLQTQSIIILSWDGFSLHLSWFAVIVPLAVWIACALISYITAARSQTFSEQTCLPWLAVSAFAAFVLATIDYLAFTLDGEFYPRAMLTTIIPFTIGPVVCASLMFSLKKESWPLEGHDRKRNWMLTRILLFGVLHMSIVFSDILTSLPPFSPKNSSVFIGAAGPFDGVFWAPLLSVIICELSVSIKQLV